MYILLDDTILNLSEIRSVRRFNAYLGSRPGISFMTLDGHEDSGQDVYFSTIEDRDAAWQDVLQKLGLQHKPGIFD
jgi:hypothetical protein